ncbi:MAG: DUF1559 domain-containing protein [Planctomycetota bacterium]
MSLKRTAYIIISASILIAAIYAASIFRYAVNEAIRMRAYGRLSQLKLAMSNYETVNQSLPLREVRAESGAITFSWMVEILPYFEQKDLYEEIDLESDWNSDENRSAIQSGEVFWTWVRDDGYFPCPIDSKNSIWDTETGTANGLLKDNCEAIALVSVPLEHVHPLEPFAIREPELIRLLEASKRVFFIDCCGNCGDVELEVGVLVFKR